MLKKTSLPEHFLLDFADQWREDLAVYLLRFFCHFSLSGKTLVDSGLYLFLKRFCNLCSIKKENTELVRVQ